MPDVYRIPAREALSGQRTLVVHCSSAAYQPYFEQFLDQSLRLDHYGLLAVPGGVHSLTLLEYLPKYSWSGWRWLKFLVDVDNPTRLILIGHQDCRWYADPRFWEKHRSERERQIEDLRGAGAECAKRFPDTKVELYFARKAGGEVIFESC
jgi:hypothetical protein